MQTVLNQMEGTIQKVCLYKDGPLLLDWENLIAFGQYNHPMLMPAREFAQANEIVVASVLGPDVPGSGPQIFGDADIETIMEVPKRKI